MTEEEIQSTHVIVDLQVTLKSRDMPLMLRYSIELEPEARGDLKTFMQFAVGVIESLMDSRSEDKIILFDVESANVHYVMRDEIQAMCFLAPDSSSLPEWFLQEAEADDE